MIRKFRISRKGITFVALLLQSSLHLSKLYATFLEDITNRNLKVELIFPKNGLHIWRRNYIYLKVDFTFL